MHTTSDKMTCKTSPVTHSSKRQRLKTKGHLFNNFKNATKLTNKPETSPESPGDQKRASKQPKQIHEIRKTRKYEENRCKNTLYEHKQEQTIMKTIKKMKKH